MNQTPESRLNPSWDPARSHSSIIPGVSPQLGAIALQATMSNLFIYLYDHHESQPEPLLSISWRHIRKIHYHHPSHHQCSSVELFFRLGRQRQCLLNPLPEAIQQRTTATGSIYLNLLPGSGVGNRKLITELLALKYIRSGTRNPGVWLRSKFQKRRFYKKFYPNGVDYFARKGVWLPLHHLTAYEPREEAFQEQSLQKRLEAVMKRRQQQQQTQQNLFRRGSDAILHWLSSSLIHLIPEEEDEDSGRIPRGFSGVKGAYAFQDRYDRMCAGFRRIGTFFRKLVY